MPYKMTGLVGWDAPEDDSSSSQDVANAKKYLPTSSGSLVKVLSRAEKIKALKELKRASPHEESQFIKF